MNCVTLDFFIHHCDFSHVAQWSSLPASQFIATASFLRMRSEAWPRSFKRQLLASSASFLFWWQTLRSPCKHLDYAASCILSCCSFYLEFTSLADSVVTKELHAFALQAA